MPGFERIIIKILINALIQPAVWNIEKLESLSWKVGIEIGKNISTKTLSKTSLPNEIRAFQRKTFQLLVISNWDKL